MAKLFPFKGILYNSKKLKKLAKVMSPPYDVIPPEKQQYYYGQSPYNVIKLILGKEFPGDTQYNNKYVRAAATLTGWLKHGVLQQDLKPAMYIYEQRFTYKGKKYTRLGFITLLRLEDSGRGRVFPHEETLLKPKLDRIELLRATHANFDSVFSLFSDEKGKIVKILKKFMRRKPAIEVKDENNIIHRLWRIDARGAINRIMAEMRDRPVFIADGHHRFEAATRFKNEMKERNTRFTEEESYNHVMMYFTPVENPGLLMFPIHRLVKPLAHFDVQEFETELGNYFEIITYPFGKRTYPRVLKKALRELEKRSSRHSYLMLIKGRPHLYLLTLKTEEAVDVLLEEEKPAAYKHLDVTILHTIIMKKILDISSDEHIEFTKNAEEVVEKVTAGSYQLGFLLNPTRIPSILEIAGEGERLPQKSTYFYPKLLSGLVMNKIDLGEKINY
jgi:uncharacterized protein (DUF1015 family)